MIEQRTHLLSTGDASLIGDGSPLRVHRLWSAPIADSMASAENSLPGPVGPGGRSTVLRARVMVGLSLAALLAAGIWLLFGAGRSGRRTGQAREVRLLTQERVFPPQGRFAKDP